MNSSQVIALLNDLEARYPVTEWEIDGVRVWPILRARIYSAIIFNYLSSTGSHPASRSTRLKRLLTAPKSLLKTVWATLRDFSKTQLSFRSADVLILGDGTGFTKLEGAWYD